MKQVYDARDLAEAHFLKGLLESEQINTLVQGGPLQAVLGEVPTSPESLPSVWVDDGEVTRALQIIDEMRHGGPAANQPQESWACPNCSEVLEGQFSSCWHCGHPRANSAPE